MSSCNRTRLPHGPSQGVRDGRDQGTWAVATPITVLKALPEHPGGVLGDVRRVDGVRRVGRS
jgi:hypothetical protein